MDDFVLRDAEFHRSLAKTAGNPFMAHLSCIIQNLMEPLLRAVVRACRSTAQCLDADHLRICNAIASRDSAAASAEMVRHMMHIRDAVTLLFDTGGGVSSESSPACWHAAINIAPEVSHAPTERLSQTLCDAR